MSTTSDVKVTPGSGKNVATYSFSEDAETKEAQRVVLNDSTGAESGTTANPTKTSIAWSQTDAWPMYSNMDVGGYVPAVDVFGALLIRGAVSTDEGVNRANFTGSAFTTTLGSCTFTNGSATVTGSGFTSIDLHYLDWVKLNADAETAWAMVSFINSDTELTLNAVYTGTGGTGTASRSPVGTVTGSGATLSVASGQATIAAGTTNASTSSIYKASTGNSQVAVSKFSLSQRISTQDWYFGFEYNPLTTNKSFSRFHFDGTTNTTVKCETAYNPTTTPSASETETTTVTLPSAGTTAASQTYKIEQRNENTIFYINDVKVATHTQRLPHIQNVNPAAFGLVDIRVLNGTGPSATSCVIEYMYVKSFDQLDVYQAIPTPDSGFNPYFIDAVTTAATVSSVPTKIGSLSIINTNSTLAWMQVFDTTGSVTLGTTVPNASFPIPINATNANGAGSNINFGAGLNLNNGLKIAFTTTAKGATTVSTGISGTLLYRAV